MRLKLGNVQCKVVEATDRERRWLFEYLSFADDEGNPVAHLRGAPKMFNDLAGTFATGFLPLVRAAAREAGHKVEMAEDGRRRAPDPVDADLSWLREDQAEAVRVGLRARRGIFWWPTASGKTEIAVGLARRVPGRWLHLVPQVSLINQTAERFELRTGEPAGRIGDSEWREERFTVAMFQTLARKLKDGDARALALLAGAEGLGVDECHTMPANSFWRVVMRCGAYYRFGYSGTPLDRTDQRSVLAIGALGPIIHRAHAEGLIRQGTIARPVIRLVEVAHEVEPGQTWAEVYEQCVISSAHRNALVLQVAMRAARPCLLFVRSIAHGRALEVLLGRRMQVAFVWGNASTDQREEAVKHLVRGEVDVLITSAVFEAGVDIPSVRSVVVASGGKSTIAALQRVGRGLRVTADKTEVEVWDFADEGHRWLQRHTAARKRAYRREGYAVSLVSWPALVAEDAAQGKLPL